MCEQNQNQKQYLPPTPTFQSLLLCGCAFVFRLRELKAAKIVIDKFSPFLSQLLIVWFDVAGTGEAAQVQHDTLSADFFSTHQAPRMC